MDDIVDYIPPMPRPVSIDGSDLTLRLSESF